MEGNTLISLIFLGNMECNTLFLEGTDMEGNSQFQ
jgi:hypothetical protein